MARSSRRKACCAGRSLLRMPRQYSRKPVSCWPRSKRPNLLCRLKAKMRLDAISLALVMSFATSTSFAQHPSADGAGQTFNTLSEQYFQQVYFKYAPTAGTTAGLHQYDTQLEDYSAATIQKQIATLHDWEKKVAAVDASALDAEPAADHDILLNAIRAQLLQLEVIRGWEKNPDNYSTGVTNAIFTIMERPYAPVNVRLHAAVEREKLIPQVFIEARKNLKNPPRIYTEIALQQIDDD